MTTSPAFPLGKSHVWLLFGPLLPRMAPRPPLIRKSLENIVQYLIGRRYLFEFALGKLDIDFVPGRLESGESGEPLRKPRLDFAKKPLCSLCRFQAKRRRQFHKLPGIDTAKARFEFACRLGGIKSREPAPAGFLKSGPSRPVILQLAVAKEFGPIGDVDAASLPAINRMNRSARGCRSFFYRKTRHFLPSSCINDQSCTIEFFDIHSEKGPCWNRPRRCFDLKESLVRG